MSIDIGGSEGSKLDAMPSIDLLTIAVLVLDSYVLYQNVDSFNRDEIFSISSELHIIAVQATFIVTLLYLIEFYADKKARN